VASIGLTAQEALDICMFAGRCRNVCAAKHQQDNRSTHQSNTLTATSHSLTHSYKVRLMDLSEYNPLVEEWRTGKLVANMFYYFCMGVAARA
jgi:hypothetical protein